MKRFILTIVLLVVPAATAAAFDMGGVTNVDAGGDQPFGATFTPDGETLLVSHFGNFFSSGQEGETIAFVDVDSGVISDVITVGLNPVDIAVHPSGVIAYVVDSADSTVTVINLPARAVTDVIPVGMAADADTFAGTYPFSASITPDSRSLYIGTTGGDLDGTDDNVVVVDVHPRSRTFHQVTDAIHTPGGVTRFAFDAARGLAYAGYGFKDNDFGAQPHILVLDWRRDVVVDSFPINVVGDGFHGIEDVAITPDGRTLYAPVFDYFGGTDEVFVVDTAERRVTDIMVTGRGMNQHGIGMTVDGAFAVVTNFFSDRASVFLTGADVRIAEIPVGFGGNEVAVDPTDRFLAVTNQFSNSLTLVDLRPTEDVIADALAGADAHPAARKRLERRIERCRRFRERGIPAYGAQVQVLLDEVEQEVEAGRVRDLGVDAPIGSTPSADANGLPTGG